MRVENIGDIIANIITVESYLKEYAPKEQFDEMAGYIKRGHNFVAYRFGKEWHFVPSKFVGYKNNNLAKHKAFKEDGSVEYSGRKTDGWLNSVLKAEMAPNDNLAKKFKKYCQWLGFDYGYSVPKFWVLKEDIDHIHPQVYNEAVVLKQLSLREVLVDMKLHIPPYQRIYCWQEKTVNKLLADLLNTEEKVPYCIGNIILQKKGDAYDIIDGQQRLVTLSMLLLQLQMDQGISLLDEKFENLEAQKYIQYNKYLISNFCARNSFKNKELLLGNISLNVLILEGGSLDLAYTFFSNENSHGKPLSDYDLLKAHHLRYVQYEAQQMHLAHRWDEYMKKDKPKNTDYQLYEQVLAIYIYRLRKWLNFEWWNEGDKYNVKHEFEASPVIDAIPPFGEQFNYYEPIQGGTHFFEFTDKAIEKLKVFIRTPEFEMIHRLNTESFKILRDTIEALTFAYFFKFGTSYLTEALLLISRFVSQVRYENQRIYLTSVFERARLSKIPLMIEQSTSPTFFLASLNSINQSLMNLDQIKNEEKRHHVSDIRERYNKRLAEVCFRGIDEKELVLANINEWK